jgi:farnesyl diphosphate synthase
LLSEAIRYSVLGGGKRLRPILVYLIGELGNAENDSLDILAGLLEIIHCYSLIHDDLPSMDDDDLRRGKPTTHKKYDEATAILAGDALQPFAFELVTTINTSDKNKLSIIKSLAEACGYQGMVGGQIKDIHSNDIKDVKSLDIMHSQKTGSLIQCSIETAGILSDLSKQDIESLIEYGDKIGLAFQIQDDIIDIESPSTVSGKDQGSDVEKDKLTYPSIVGIENSKDRAFDLAKEAKEKLQLLERNTDNLCKLADYIVSRKT